jgi:hypothetical protein
MIVCCACSLSVAAQVNVNKDSLSLVKKLAQDREKLLKWQSEVADRTREKEETAIKAQQSADENRRAAERLSNNPQDSKLARKADNSASDARSDAKKARRASDRLDELKKDILDLKGRVEKNEAKLNQYVLVPGASSAGTGITGDSTRVDH